VKFLCTEGDDFGVEFEIPVLLLLLLLLLLLFDVCLFVEEDCSAIVTTLLKQKLILKY
jgi:hypothetical protein